MTTPVQIIPNKQSSSQSWIQWHKAMKTRYGLKEANKLFIKAWDQRAGAGSSASTNELRTYMADNKVVLDSSTLETIADAGYSGLDSIGNALTIGKYAVLGLGGVIFIGIAMAVYNVAKQPIKAVGNIAPVGKINKLLQ